VEDYHVDRLGVEVQQCMKLTSTNNSIGLIVLITNAHFDGLKEKTSYMPSADLVVIARWLHPIPFRTRP
jgi:hypothetical protein